MHKCPGRGKEFINSQGPGSHRRLGCKTQSTAVVLANEVAQAAGKYVPQISNFRSQTSDVTPQYTAGDVARLKKEAERTEALAKSTKRKQYAELKRYRQLAILVALAEDCLWL